MRTKMKKYRVVLFNEHDAIKGLCSEFEKHQTLDEAQKWAIKIGKERNAEYVRLYEKYEDRYNQYFLVKELEIIAKL